jgi:hypothetical protein
MQKWLEDNWDKYMGEFKPIKYDHPLHFIPLNKCKPGYHAHHIDRDHVIYIPEKLHNSIRHDLGKGTNMEVINNLATYYLDFALCIEGVLG